MNDNTILRIKVPAHLYESVKEQLTINEAKKSGKAFSDWKVVKEKKMPVPKDGMKKVEELNNLEEKEKDMDKKPRTLDELKKAKEKLEKKINEMEGGSDEKITLSLKEFHGDQASYDLGMWAIDHFPKIADALKGAVTGDGQEIVDLGNTIVGLATAGTITIGVGLAMAKDSIVDAAKKLKAAMSGVKEGEQVDPELADIAAKLKAEKGIDEKKEHLKEYEVIYVVRNGKCYRKDDEGNMDEVSMSKCK